MAAVFSLPIFEDYVHTIFLIYQRLEKSAKCTLDSTYKSMSQQSEQGMLAFCKFLSQIQFVSWIAIELNEMYSSFYEIIPDDLIPPHLSVYRSALDRKHQVLCKLLQICQTVFATLWMTFAVLMQGCLLKVISVTWQKVKPAPLLLHQYSFLQSLSISAIRSHPSSLNLPGGSLACYEGTLPRAGCWAAHQCMKQIRSNNSLEAATHAAKKSCQ